MTVHRDRPFVRHALISVLIVCSLLTISACTWLRPGGEEDRNQGDGGKQTGAFTIRVGAWFIDDREVMKQFQANTEKAFRELYPLARIQWETKLGNDYYRKLETQLASQSAPDVFYHQHVVALTEAGYLADLSDEPWAKQFIPQVQQFLSYKTDKEEYQPYAGKVFAASMGVGVKGYWYNKSIFEKLDLQAPRNLLELLEVCRNLKQAGIIPIAAGFKDLWSMRMYFESLLQSVGYGNDEAYGSALGTGSKRLDGPEAQAAMQFFERLKKLEYINQNALSIDWGQSVQLLTSGRAAIVMQGPWLPGAVGDKIKLGFFPIADENGYYDMVFSTDQFVSVNAATPLLEEAKDLVRIMLSKDIYIPFSSGNGLLPALKNMEPTFDKPVMAELMDYSKQAQSYPSWPLFISTPSIDALMEELQGIISGVPFDPKRLGRAQELQEEMLRQKQAQQE
ncbi:ABC transporter substrate-binding protein [Paenibacillus mendelii]|uniref:ABC transporter substrate-binding protein n=1 Tax=Paenibacillus mendelii TaxID=206163 RepID=A0ABV6JIT6_9BACL|nr:extracellular solute-binding protein [Paenibacillus mendelii]MCQ6558756.1 extracellular solute-binding protein [Paenibacillus mendelii]